MFIEDKKLYINNECIYLDNVALVKNKFAKNKAVDIAYNVFVNLQRHNVNLDKTIVGFVNNNTKKTVIIHNIVEHNKRKNTILAYYNIENYDDILYVKTLDSRVSKAYGISADDNKLYIRNGTSSTTIYYSEKFSENINIDGARFFFSFFDNFIFFDKNRVNVCYSTPQTLLLKFLQNIYAFEKPNNFVINNEHDLLKYI